MRKRVSTKSPVRENCTPGSVRGLSGNRQSYRDLRSKESTNRPWPPMSFYTISGLVGFNEFSTNLRGKAAREQSAYCPGDFRRPEARRQYRTITSNQQSARSTRRTPLTASQTSVRPSSCSNANRSDAVRRQIRVLNASRICDISLRFGSCLHCDRRL